MSSWIFREWRSHGGIDKHRSSCIHGEYFYLIFVCFRVCVCLCVRGCVYVCMHKCVFVCLPVNACVCAFASVCKYVCTCVCVCVCVFMCVCVKPDIKACHAHALAVHCATSECRFNLHTHNAKRQGQFKTDLLGTYPPAPPVKNKNTIWEKWKDVWKANFIRHELFIAWIENKEMLCILSFMSHPTVEPPALGKIRGR